MFTFSSQLEEENFRQINKEKQNRQNYTVTCVILTVLF